MLKPSVRGFFDSVTSTWTYVVYDEKSLDRRCAVIDSVLDYDMFSGRVHTASADRVVDFLEQQKLEVQWILETHIHADHLTAAAYLKEKVGGKTAISKHVLKVLEVWEPVFHNEVDTPKDGSQFDCLFDDNKFFDIGSLRAQIIHTPGHTPSDTTYLIGDAVFVGDTMFLPDVGTGRCDFPGGSAEDSYQSCRMLCELPDDCRMYVGHDYPPKGVREPQCMALIKEQRLNNIRVKGGISQTEFVTHRLQDDKNKATPKMLLPALQVNLRAGNLGQATQGVQYIKLPVNML